MHSLLVLRADRLTGCIEGSVEELELKKIADTVGPYEAKRWPDGVVPGGKGSGERNANCWDDAWGMARLYAYGEIASEQLSDAPAAKLC